MGTVSIDGTSFTVYGTLTACDAFHKATLSGAATAWRASDDDTKAMGLVNASRLLDRERWQGTPVGTPVIDSVLEWPRNNVTDRYGNAVSNASTPDDVVKAAYELAAMLVEDPTLADLATSGSNVASVGAGSATVSFFRPTLGITGKYGTKITALIGQYLESGSASAAGEAFGTDETSGGTPESSVFEGGDFSGLSGNI